MERGHEPAAVKAIKAGLSEGGFRNPAQPCASSTEEDGMKKEINPVVAIVVVVVIVAAVIFFYWRATAPEGVKTPIPPRPNPPSGIPVPTE